MISAAGYEDWYIGLALSFFVIVVVVRAQTTILDTGVDRVNDSAVRILQMARVLRKVAVGK
jgi:hypothetical protein